MQNLEVGSFYGRNKQGLTIRSMNVKRNDMKDLNLLSPQQQKELGEYYGKIEVHPQVPQVPGVQGVTVS